MLFQHGCYFLFKNESGLYSKPSISPQLFINTVLYKANQQKNCGVITILILEKGWPLIDSLKVVIRFAAKFQMRITRTESLKIIMGNRNGIILIEFSPDVLYHTFSFNKHKIIFDPIIVKNLFSLSNSIF